MSILHVTDNTSVKLNVKLYSHYATTVWALSVIKQAKNIKGLLKPEFIPLKYTVHSLLGKGKRKQKQIKKYKYEQFTLHMTKTRI